MELECESSFQSLDESEGSAAYEGDVSLAESFASVDQSDEPVSETESETSRSSCSQPITSGAPPIVSCPTTSSPYTGALRKTRTKPQSSLRYHAINARQQAALIQAKTRIVQLESEVSSLQHTAKRARIEECDGGRIVTKSGDQMLSVEQEERMQQLETERCELLKELALVKEKLSDTEGHLVKHKERVKELTDSYEQDTKELRREVEDLKTELDDVTMDNDKLHTQLTQFQLQAAEMKRFEIEKLKESYDSAIQTLRSRIREFECIESKLVHSESEKKQLQRSMRAHKQDYFFVESEKEKLFKYDEIERQLRLLTEENTLLRKQRDNADLLKYKVQSLQEKCATYEGLEAKVAELELTNQELRKQIEEGQGEGGEMKTQSGGGQPALQYRIAELQHKEVLLLSKQGELLTSIKLAESAAAEVTQSLEEVKKKLSKEQELVQSKDERIQRLEKRLLFVTKERDGCVNVLNSYRLDAGVDAVLKEQVTELEQQLARAKERITELESEVDGGTKTETPKKEEDTHNQ